MKSIVFSHVTPYGLVEVYQRFERIIPSILKIKSEPRNRQGEMSLCYLDLTGCFAYLFTLKTEEVNVFEMSMNFYQTIGRHIPAGKLVKFSHT
jgi:hypothetical protein